MEKAHDEASRRALVSILFDFESAELWQRSASRSNPIAAYCSPFRSPRPDLSSQRHASPLNQRGDNKLMESQGSQLNNCGSTQMIIAPFSWAVLTFSPSALHLYSYRFADAGAHSLAIAIA